MTVIAKPDVGATTMATLHATQHGEPVEVPIVVDLCWYSRDPLAVALAFRNSRTGWVVWTVAVELIRDALIQTRPVGEGDARIQQLNGATVRVELTSPTGQALCEFDRSKLDKLLARIDEHYPPWTVLDEHTLDTELHQLLGNGDATA